MIFLRYGFVLVAIGLTTGTACALFLALLDFFGRVFSQHAWLLFTLPALGVAIAWSYQRWGQNVQGGTKQLIDALENPESSVPFRMAPMIFLSTLATHLGGGSAGREGTAVQMGGGIAGGMMMFMPNRDPEVRRSLMLAGMAAGFGGVFGTPYAGMLFATELLYQRRRRIGWGFLACGVASWISHLTCLSCGIQHTLYSIDTINRSTSLIIDFQPIVLYWIFGAITIGMAASLVARLFIASMHFVSKCMLRIPSTWSRPVIGALLVIVTTWLIGRRDHLGLGVESSDSASVSILSSFHEQGAGSLSWLIKLIATVFTLASGFKGGEVTPLFYIGATMGNQMGVGLAMPIDLAAGLGMIAVFAAATRTPLASVVMGMELFGFQFIYFLVPACSVATWLQGVSTIYEQKRSNQDDSTVR